MSKQDLYNDLRELLESLQSENNSLYTEKKQKLEPKILSLERELDAVKKGRNE